MPAHPVEPLIASRGLRRACLYLDTACAVHRCNIVGQSELEFEALTDEQVLMALVLTGATPDSSPWAYAEKRLGVTLPRK